MTQVVKPKFSNKDVSVKNNSYTYKGDISTTDLKNDSISLNDKQMMYKNAPLNKINLYTNPEKSQKLIDYRLKTREQYKKTGAQTGSIFSTISDSVYRFFSDTVKPKFDSAVSTFKDGVHSILERIGLIGNDEPDPSIEPDLVDYSTDVNPLPEEVTTVPNEVEVNQNHGGGGKIEKETTTKETTTEPTTKEETTIEPTTKKKEEKPVFSKTPKGDVSQMKGGYTVTCYEADGWHLNYSDRATPVAKDSDDKLVHNAFVADGARYSDEGIAVLNVDGEDRYLVAVKDKYGKAGDKIDVVLEDGTSVKCVIADAKGPDATHEDGHMYGKTVSILELEVSTDYARKKGCNSNGTVVSPGSDAWPLPWDSHQNIVRIDNYGSAI